MKEKKITRILRIFMMLLTCILIGLFFGIMILVSDMQGTARVVNYAGLVRGKTQQIIKLENAQRPQDEMIREVDAYIDGLRHGSDELNLVHLDHSENTIDRCTDIMTHPIHEFCLRTALEIRFFVCNLQTFSFSVFLLMEL